MKESFNTILQSCNHSKKKKNDIQPYVQWTLVNVDERAVAQQLWRYAPKKQQDVPVMPCTKALTALVRDLYRPCSSQDVWKSNVVIKLSN